MWKYVLELCLMLLVCLGAGSVIYHFHTETPQELGSVESPQGSDCARNANADADPCYFLSHAGRQRQYLVHVPPRRARVATPVVINFHGAQGTAASQGFLSRMNDVADAHGFLVVNPEGIE